MELGFLGGRNMEQEETEKRKRRRTQTSISSLPVDLTSQILSKLPAKAVARSRCLSKPWSSITTDPYFISSFKGWPKLLLFFKAGDKFFVFFIPQHNQNRSESSSSLQPINSYVTTFPKRCSFTIKTESVNGLICFKKTTNPIVWNPTMRTFLTLPRPEKSWKAITVFLGYDPVEGKHKVVCLFRDTTCDDCRISTLGSPHHHHESWRRVKLTNQENPPPAGLRNFAIGDNVQGICINGVLYYLAWLNRRRVIMRFDVRSERFDVIETPLQGVWCMKMVPYEGRLAFVNTTKDTILMWVLEDAEKGQWCNHSFLPLSHYGQHLVNYRLVGINVEGELIYVPKMLDTCFHIVYIDPKRKKLRRVEYGGIVDNDFCEQNGLGDKPLCGFQFVPNHIEAGMSL